MLGLIRMLGLAPTAGSAPADAEVSRREPAVPRNPLPVRERARLASRPPSITDLLPWRDFDEKTGTFLLEDGVSRALLYELDPMPSEACADQYLKARCAEVQAALQALPEYDEAPWVVQFFCNDDTDLSWQIERIRDYIVSVHAKAPERARQILASDFTRHFLAEMAEHLSLVARPEGLFLDEGVSGNRWRGQIRRVRCAIYRRFPPRFDFSRELLDPVETLQQTARGLVAGLAQTGIHARPMNAADFYSWLLPFFNPKPDFAKTVGDLLRLCPYPQPDEAPDDLDLGELLFLAAPKSDPTAGLWFFDGRPVRALALQSMRKLPEIGHFTAERDHAGKLFARFDRFPEGTMLSATVVICPQDTMTGRIEAIKSASRANILEAAHTYDEAVAVLDNMRTDKLYPMYLTLFVRGEDTSQLGRTVADLTAALHTSGLRFIQPVDELHGCDVFLRALPMCFDPRFDARHLRRSRLAFASQIASLLPLYGRARGTGNPGFWLWNRGGEPLLFDPLNPHDRNKNAHLLTLGPTGAGKSATLCYLAMQMMAIYRPRFFIIDAGKSFGLLGEHMRRHGLTVNQVELTPDTHVSLPPFAMAPRLFDQEGIKALDEAFGTADDDELPDSDPDGIPASPEDDDEGADPGKRDILGEMVIATTLMITGGEECEMRKMSRADRYLVARGILAAARQARDRGQPHPRVQDVAQALMAMRGDEDLGPSRRDRAEEMGQAMMVFCDGLRGRLFNRYGATWPDADVTIVEMGTLAQEGYEDALAVAYTSLITHVQALAEATQYDHRPIINLTDEGHIITANDLLNVYSVKITKMWRKLGAWYWLGTQNMQDFPASASRILNMCEHWVLLTMDRDEIAQVARFRTLTPEQRALMESARKEPPKYTEGVILNPQMQALFRNVPPPLAIALAMTEKHEKAWRLDIMKATGCTELEAAYAISREIAAKRAA
ncbi:conjugative transfer ATPase [Aromatoleum toluolicum]|uniref:Conjugative transfer ATPase n=1 Tax=Aromatoleum toluolicum TaxID=90060 RepID=A0ABX1NN11_9RHOO|nr:conjugative transfer ATPase [Aromatoleum toluolicum]NMG00739.1 conjugative transfer ATPase [Aromatoleum toluolicum]